MEVLAFWTWMLLPTERLLKKKKTAPAQTIKKTEIKIPKNIFCLKRLSILLIHFWLKKEIFGYCQIG
jgi:hypothetical protein